MTPTPESPSVSVSGAALAYLVGYCESAYSRGPDTPGNAEMRRHLDAAKAALTQPQPENSSVSREQLETALRQVIANCALPVETAVAVYSDGKYLSPALVEGLQRAAATLRETAHLLTQPQPEAPARARVTIERETLELVCNEIQMHADTLRPAEELDFTVHGLDGLHSLLSGALTRSQPEAPAPALPAKVRWIPVEERLPEEWQEVLFCLESEKVACGFRVGEKWYMSDERPVNIRTTVTHWMPFPEPPADRLRALAGAEAGEQNG